MGGFMSATDSEEQIDINALADVAIPDNLTAEDCEAMVEFDSRDEMAGELTELLEAVTADRHPQVEEVEETEEDTAPQLSLKEQLQAVDTFRRICQNRGFENGYEAARKIERDLHLEEVNSKKQTTLDKYFLNCA
ncbi:hypothetical protein EOD39_5360 [Acipenser ruthenus]|uniref:Uncharacterized protein n=1 Tax=Acipenser ruthenus TaxID=7906 RepID=A0A444TW42_ACIRT|nr:hypothetical protein EOD39_5360 [Acipenser ruthenus]